MTRELIVVAACFGFIVGMLGDVLHIPTLAYFTISFISGIILSQLWTIVTGE